MKLIDLDQRVIVPVVDESRGGMRYEMEMSVGELLGKALEDFKPAVVEAIPVEWLHKKREQMIDAAQNTQEQTIAYVLWMWQKEQEART